MHINKIATAALSLTLLMIGCGGGSDKKAKGATRGSGKACLNIVNGKRTSGFPSVVMITSVEKGDLTGVCTGTFVGPNVLLTASHCGVSEDTESLLYIKGDDVDIGTGKTRRTELIKSGIRAKRIMILSKKLTKGDSSKMADSHQDLALMIFSKNVAPAISPLMTGRAGDNDKITMVGFGMTSLVEAEIKKQGNDTRNSKRYGYNKISSLPEGIAPIEGIYFVAGRSANDGSGKAASDSAASHGDSGGPIFVGKALAGVASTGVQISTMDKDVREAFGEFDSMNVYADVSNDAAISFFKKGEAAGAVFQRATVDDEKANLDASGDNADASTVGADDSCS